MLPASVQGNEMSVDILHLANISSWFRLTTETGTWSHESEVTELHLTNGATLGLLKWRNSDFSSLSNRSKDSYLPQ